MGLLGQVWGKSRRNGTSRHVCSDAKSDVQADRSVNLECDAGKSEVRLRNSI